MEKKICKYCGKEMDRIGYYQSCICEKDIYNEGNHRITFHTSAFNDLIAMKQEHAQLKAEAERTRWHSVEEEGLPTEEDMYAVTFAGTSRVTALDFDGKYFFEYDDEGTRHTFNEYIIAWAELPVPYKK